MRAPPSTEGTARPCPSRHSVSGSVLRPHVPVPRIAARPALVVRPERRRAYVVAAAPELDLLLAVAPRRLGLVQPLQRAVVPLVQPPVPQHRNPHQVHLVEHNPESPDGALQDRGVGNVESTGPLPGARCPACPCLLDTGIREIDVRPAGEEILLVPHAFPVTQQNKAMHSNAPVAITLPGRRSVLSVPSSTV